MSSCRLLCYLRTPERDRRLCGGEAGWLAGGEQREETSSGPALADRHSHLQGQLDYLSDPGDERCLLFCRGHTCRGGFRTTAHAELNWLQTKLESLSSDMRMTEMLQPPSSRSQVRSRWLCFLGKLPLQLCVWL